MGSRGTTASVKERGLLRRLRRDWGVVEMCWTECVFFAINRHSYKTPLSSHTSQSHYMYPHILVVGIFIHGDDGCQKFNKWKLEGGFFIYLYFLFFILGVVMVVVWKKCSFHNYAVYSFAYTCNNTRVIENRKNLNMKTEGKGRGQMEQCFFGINGAPLFKKALNCMYLM